MRSRFIPRLTLDRGVSQGHRYTELRVRFLGWKLFVNLDERGLAITLDERNTDRFVQWYLDKPTREINCRISYRKE